MAELPDSRPDSGAELATGVGDGLPHKLQCRWTLKGFNTGKMLKSPSFTVRGVDGKEHDGEVLVYPRGDGQATTGHVSVYLQLSVPRRNSRWDCFASYRLSLCVDGREMLSKDSWHRFSAKKKSHGWCEFATHAALAGAGTLPDALPDSVTLSLGISILAEGSSFIREPDLSGRVGPSSENALAGRLVWTVQNFNEFLPLLRTQKIMSPAFTAGDIMLRMSVYITPQSDGELLSLCLESKDGDGRGAAEKSTWCLFRLGVHPQGPGSARPLQRDSYGRLSVNGAGGESTSLGWTDFMRLSDFARAPYLLGGVVIFSASYQVLRETTSLTLGSDIRAVAGGPGAPGALGGAGVGPSGAGGGGGTLGALRRVTSATSTAPREADCAARFTWRIDNFTRLKDALKKRKISGLCIKSQRFRVGARDCRLIVYPRGQSQPPTCLSLFLEVWDPAPQAFDWTSFVSHRLAVVNQRWEERSIAKESQNRYSCTAKDWGWRDFVSLTTLFDADAGFLVDDQVVFTADALVLKESSDVRALPLAPAELGPPLDRRGAREPITADPGGGVRPPQTTARAAELDDGARGGDEVEEKLPPGSPTRSSDGEAGDDDGAAAADAAAAAAVATAASAGLGAASPPAEVRAAAAPLLGDDGASPARVVLTWRVENLAAFRDILETRKIFSRFFPVGPIQLRIGLYDSLDSLCLYLEGDAAAPGPFVPGTPPAAAGGAELPLNHWVRYRLSISGGAAPATHRGGPVAAAAAVAADWREASLNTRSWNNGVLQYPRLGPLLEGAAGKRRPLVVTCEVLEVVPWPDFKDTGAAPGLRQGLGMGQADGGKPGPGAPAFHHHHHHHTHRVPHRHHQRRSSQGGPAPPPLPAAGAAGAGAHTRRRRRAVAAAEADRSSCDCESCRGASDDEDGYDDDAGQLGPGSYDGDVFTGRSASTGDRNAPNPDDHCDDDEDDEEEEEDDDDDDEDDEDEDDDDEDESVDSGDVLATWLCSAGVQLVGGDALPPCLASPGAVQSELGGMLGSQPGAVAMFVASLRMYMDSPARVRRLLTPTMCIDLAGAPGTGVGPRRAGGNAGAANPGPAPCTGGPCLMTVFAGVPALRGALLTMLLDVMLDHCLTARMGLAGEADASAPGGDEAPDAGPPPPAKVLGLATQLPPRDSTPAAKPRAEPDAGDAGPLTTQPAAATMTAANAEVEKVLSGILTWLASSDLLAGRGVAAAPGQGRSHARGGAGGKRTAGAANSDLPVAEPAAPAAIPPQDGWPATHAPLSSLQKVSMLLADIPASLLPDLLLLVPSLIEPAEQNAAVGALLTFLSEAGRSARCGGRSLWLPVLTTCSELCLGTGAAFVVVQAIIQAVPFIAETEVEQGAALVRRVAMTSPAAAPAACALLRSLLAGPGQPPERVARWIRFAHSAGLASQFVADTGAGCMAALLSAGRPGGVDPSSGAGDAEPAPRAVMTVDELALLLSALAVDDVAPAEEVGTTTVHPIDEAGAGNEASRPAVPGPRRGASAAVEWGLQAGCIAAPALLRASRLLVQHWDACRVVGAATRAHAIPGAGDAGHAGAPDDAAARMAIMHAPVAGGSTPSDASKADTPHPGTPGSNNNTPAAPSPIAAALAGLAAQLLSSRRGEEIRHAGADLARELFSACSAVADRAALMRALLPLATHECVADDAGEGPSSVAAPAEPDADSGAESAGAKRGHATARGGKQGTGDTPPGRKRQGAKQPAEPAPRGGRAGTIDREDRTGVQMPAAGDERGGDDGELGQKEWLDTELALTEPAPTLPDTAAAAALMLEFLAAAPELAGPWLASATQLLQRMETRNRHLRATLVSTRGAAAAAIAAAASREADLQQALAAAEGGASAAADRADRMREAQRASERQREGAARDAAAALASLERQLEWAQEEARVAVSARARESADSAGHAAELEAQLARLKATRKEETKRTQRERIAAEARIKEAEEAATRSEAALAATTADLARERRLAGEAAATAARNLAAEQARRVEATETAVARANELARLRSELSSLKAAAAAAAAAAQHKAAAGVGAMPQQQRGIHSSPRTQLGPKDATAGGQLPGSGWATSQAELLSLARAGDTSRMAFMPGAGGQAVTQGMLNTLAGNGEFAARLASLTAAGAGQAPGGQTPAVGDAGLGGQGLGTLPSSVRTSLADGTPGREDAAGSPGGHMDAAAMLDLLPRDLLHS